MSVNARYTMKPYQDISDLESNLPFKRDTIAAMTKDGRLPKGTMVGGKLVWIWADVDSAMRVLLGKRSSETAIADEVFHATRKRVNGR